MELALSLGNRGVVVVADNNNNNNNNNNATTPSVNFCMGLSPPKSTAEIKQPEDHDHDHDKMIITRDDEDNHDHDRTVESSRRLEKVGSSSSSDPTAGISPRQLDLLPFSPVPRQSSATAQPPPPPPPPPPPLRFPWLSDNLSSEPGSSDGGPGSRIVEVNRRPAVGATAEDGDDQSSPNSGTSSFMEFSLYTSSNNNNNNCGGGGGEGEGKRRESNGNNVESGGNYLQGVIIGEQNIERGATTSRGSDDEENGSTRKKLRLSKEQSAFLEESFKEHHTLNPKQKIALAKQLNLRPRQVEVWFQNRRARTKLKQTEVDCEYLKRCCETLTEENRRLQKELQELRALKTSQPFFMQLPATTLTMCPSCERVAPTSTSSIPTTSVPTPTKPIVTIAAPATPSATSDSNADNNRNGITTLSLGKPNPMLALSCSSTPQAHQAAS